MKLTMNITGDPIVQSQPLINFVGVGVEYNSQSPFTLIRNEGVRPLTLWDMTTDLLPIQPLINTNFYKVVEWGNYNNGIYTPSINNQTILYDNNTSNYVTVGSEIQGVDLYTSLDSTNMRYFVNFTDMYVDDVPYYYYIKFLRDPDGSEIIIHFYKGTAKEAYPTINYEEEFTISEGTITPLNIQEMFNIFNYNDTNFDSIISAINEIGEPVSISLQQLYGEIASNRFLKMYLLNSNYDSTYTITPVDRLTINGQPVYYGQAINFNQATNGSILINTVGLSVGSKLEYHFGIEGVINIKIHCRVI